MNLIVPVELGDDLAHGLGRSGGGGDDVLGGATSVPPQLTGGTINGLLCGGDGMDSALPERQQKVIRTPHSLTDTCSDIFSSVGFRLKQDVDVVGITVATSCHFRQ